MKKITLALMCALALVSCAGRGGKNDSSASKELNAVYAIETNFGTIKVRLFDDTPLHRDNFISLAESHYYDSTLFHRVIAGFMIQGGDPYSKDIMNMEIWGTGGPDYTIPAEIIPGHHHAKGALAAARKGDTFNPKRASSGSQFYIVQDEQGCSHLDGQYTIFGQTVAGLDVIDRIASVETDFRDRPMTDIRIISVTRDSTYNSSPLE